MAQIHKGQRDFRLIYVLPSHKDVFNEMASKCDIPLGDYLVLVLSRTHGLEDPAYVRAGITLPPTQIEMYELPLLDEPEQIPRKSIAAIPLRIPTADRKIYDKLATKTNLTLPDYMAALLAQAHGLRIPRYLHVPAGTQLVQQPFREAA